MELTALRTGSWAMGALPDHLGQFRLAQAYWLRRRPSHQLAVQRLANGPRLSLDLGDRTQALAYLTRRYCDDLVTEIAERLPPDGTLLDVGANVGLVTFQVAHRRPDVRIAAFEPSPAASEAWIRNHRLVSAARATLARTAVGATMGRLHLEAPRDDLGGGRVTDDEAGITVPSTTLDRWCAEQPIADVDVVKIDVEGSEPDVLDGARGLLAARAIRTVILEFNDVYLRRRGESRASMIRRMADHGFALATMMPGDDAVFELAT